jgi:curved DNA-binding protein CbpA
VGALDKRDYYGDLQLPFGASEAVIRQRFKRLARKFHPDVNHAPDAAQSFRRVREAYEVLTDPRRRALVDAWYSVSRHHGRRRYQVDTPEAAPAAPTIRRVQHYEDDRGWSFGCFGLIGFVVALVGALSYVDATPGRALVVAIAVGLLVGLVAALGGARAREWLWWVLYALWS